MSLQSQGVDNMAKSAVQVLNVSPCFCECQRASVPSATREYRTETRKWILCGNACLSALDEFESILKSLEFEPPLVASMGSTDEHRQLVLLPEPRAVFFFA